MLIEQAITDALGSITAAESSDSCIWLGLSAGVDSTVLLHAAAQYCALSGITLKAIHVHHGLSDNADAWAKQAQTLCKALSETFSITIDCTVEKVQLESYRDGLEQAARSARYRIFSKYCQPNDVLLQGHHLDDQIETFFMRAIRGSGLTGLASIPRQRPLSRTNTCQILRPLLTIEKKQLLEYAKQHQLSWVEDESNQDSRIDRNWWRNELLPQIWQRYPDKKQSLSRTIINVQHEQRLLQSLLGNIINGGLEERLEKKIDEKTELRPSDIRIHSALKNIPSFDLLLIKGLDQASCLSYLRAWFAQHVDILPSAIQMQTIYADMILARADSEPNVNWSGSNLYRHHGCLYLFSELKKDLIKAGPFDWQGKDVDCFWGQLACNEQINGFGLKPAHYKIRNWQAGDVAKPFGRSTRKMKKWWQDYKVPSWVRQQWPIIVNNETDEIAAVPGLFVCQDYCVERGQSGWIVNYKVILK